MYLPDVSIIIVNWKSKDFVRRCLSSIRATSKDLRYEVIVIDNASYDGCEEMLISEFPEVTFIQSNHNLGFAGANNIAFAKSQGRNVMFLNPDTEIQGSAIQTLLAALESLSDAGMVGARLLNSDLTLQTTCVTALPSILNQALGARYLRETFPQWRIWGMRALFQNNKVPVPVEAISGACMLAKRNVIAQVGCFTADYFMYSEDMDLCVKVEKTGYKIYYVPEAKIVHHAGGSSSLHEDSNFSDLVIRDSLIRFLEIHRGRSYALSYRASTAFISICRLIILAAISPVAIHPEGYRFLSRTVSKWSAVLAWSVGLARKRDNQRPSVKANASGDNVWGEL